MTARVAPTPERAIGSRSNEVAKLGARDGASWARRITGSIGRLTVANAAGAAHLRKVLAGKLKADDVVDYGQAFVNAAFAVLEDRVTL